jgi:Secretion system C-terminal sorting domain
MKKLIYILLFLTSYSFAQELVGVKGDTKHVFYSTDADSLEVTYVKIYREHPAANILTINYTISGSGADNTDFVNGSVTLGTNEQSQRVKITPTSLPVSDETFTVSIDDASNPDYDVLAPQGSYTFTALATPLTPAFTSAQGAAKYVGSRVSANTHRGKSVYKVTNLNTSGAGSFANGYNDASVGYIVFAVEGEIPLTTRMTSGANANGKYIAGQTAPGEGIIFTGYGSTNGILVMDGSNNIIWRYVNFDHGRRLTGGTIDVVSIFDAQNIYMNHCSVIHGDDELMSAVTSDGDKQLTQITFDWLHFADAYYDPIATTNSLNHNTGSIMGALTSTFAREPMANMVGYFTYNNNLTTGVSHRMANVQSDIIADNNNNVIANHSYRIIQNGYPQPYVNWVGNWIEPGPNTNTSGGPFTAANPFTRGNKPARSGYNFDGQYLPFFYADGNVMKGFIAETDDDWAFFSYFFDIAYLDTPYPTSQKLLNPFDLPHSKTPLTAQQSYDQVLGAGGAGASKRLEGDGTVTNRRETWYQAQIDDVLNDTQVAYTDVDDWATDKPIFSTGATAYTDSDNDGMGDTWENATFGDLTKTANGQDLHLVYENIEVFLNGVDEETNPIPNVNAGQDIVLCDDGSNAISITLTATGAVTYIWNTGETTASITVNPTVNTTYSVTGTHDDGSTTTDDITVFVNPIPNVDAGVDVTINVGESTILTATGADTYLWNTGETTASITVNPTVDTTYTVTGTTNSCESTDSVTVFSVVSSAVANAGEDTAICEGETTTLTASGGTNYLWNTGETTASITVNPVATSNYTVIVSNSISSDTDDVTVFVNPVPNVQVSNDATILRGTYITLSATGANTYEWSNGATEPNIAVGPNNTTTYQVTGYINDCSDAKQVTVEVLEPVTANAGEDFTVCGGDDVTLTASGGDSYIWNTGENTQNITVSPTEDTTYTVIVSNALDSDADEVTVFVDDCLDENENQDDFQFIVFPNPTNNGLLNIKLFGLKNLSSIYIHDIIGKLVLKENLDDNNGQTILKQIDISSFSKGMYLITLFELDRTTTKKIIFN